VTHGAPAIEKVIDSTDESFGLAMPRRRRRLPTTPLRTGLGERFKGRAGSIRLERNEVRIGVVC